MSQLQNNLPDCFSELNANLCSAISKLNPDKIWIVTDSKIDPLSRDIMPGTPRIIIPEGEEHKNIDNALHIWNRLSHEGATRHSLIVNIGGGMISDLGGFAAAAFKRGIRHINVATTLLAAVDAAIGGKTGINLDGLKNEVGFFAMPEFVFNASPLFQYLPKDQWLSGYGEILKIALLIDMNFFLDACTLLQSPCDTQKLEEIVNRCGKFKSQLVAEDPKEKDRRRILNLGHTAGHAFETLCMKKGQPVPHGIAVAHGLVITLLLSINETIDKEINEHAKESTDHHKRDTDQKQDLSVALEKLTDLIRTYFGKLPLTADDIDRLIDIMGHDKKNLKEGTPAFVLLPEIGKPCPGTEIPSSRLRNILAQYFDIF